MDTDRFLVQQETDHWVVKDPTDGRTWPFKIQTEAQEWCDRWNLEHEQQRIEQERSSDTT